MSGVASAFINNPNLQGWPDLIYIDKHITKNIRFWKSNEFVPGLFSKLEPTSYHLCEALIYEKFGNFNLKYHIVSDVELMMRFLEIHKIHVGYIPEVWQKRVLVELLIKVLRIF